MSSNICCALQSRLSSPPFRQPPLGLVSHPVTADEGRQCSSGVEEAGRRSGDRSRAEPLDERCGTPKESAAKTARRPPLVSGLLSARATLVIVTLRIRRVAAYGDV